MFALLLLLYSTVLWTCECLSSEPRVYPVFVRPQRHLAPVVSKQPAESMDIVMKKSFTVEDPSPPDQQSSRGFVDINESSTWERRGADEDEYILVERSKCEQEFSLWSCWRYKTFQFLESLIDTPSVRELSNATKGRSMSNSIPLLVSFPGNVGNSTFHPLGRADKYGFGQLFVFFERQLSRFLSQHGVLFTTTSWEDALKEDFQDPVIIEDFISENEIEGGRSSTQRKHTKRKSVLFPLLVLFKFFKIKMILVPILLSVLFVKKLLILALALAPNIIGLFRVCRPGGPFGPPFGFAPTGLLQDISDSRGEFSTYYNNYVSPYGHRTKDYSRYMGESYIPRQPPGGSSQTSEYEQY